jgi:hypothetical protein
MGKRGGGNVRGGRGGNVRGGRGGSRGGATKKNPLKEAIEAQDQEAVEKTNSYVLGVVTGSKDFYDDDYEDDEEEMDEEEEDEDDFEGGTQASTQSEPFNLAKKKVTKQTGKSNGPSRVRTKTGHLKNPVQACDIMLKNLELFQRALEKKQNNQFQLVNENFCTFQATASSFFDKLFKSQQLLLKTIRSMADGINSVVKLRSNNTPLAIAKAGNVEKSSVSLSDEIVLDGDDDDELSFGNQNSLLESFNSSVKKRGPIDMIIKKEVNESGGNNSGGSSGLMTSSGSQVAACFTQMGNGVGTQMRNGVGTLMGNGVGTHMVNGVGTQMVNGGWFYNPQYGFGPENLMAGLGCFQSNFALTQTPPQTTSHAGPIDLMGLIKVCKPFKKPTLIAGAAFEFMFQNEILNGEFNNGDINVYGVAPNGQKENYRKLDESKMDALEKFVKDKMEQGVEKDPLWKKCVKAINRKIWKLCSKNKDKATPIEYEDEN